MQLHFTCVADSAGALVGSEPVLAVRAVLAGVAQTFVHFRLTTVALVAAVAVTVKPKHERTNWVTSGRHKRTDNNDVSNYTL